MSRLLKILLCIIILGLQVFWGWSYYYLNRTYKQDLVDIDRQWNDRFARVESRWVCVAEKAHILNEIGKPYAVLTIDYGEPPEGFVEGEFYVLKCLKVRATKIDYGFCPIKRDGLYTLDKEIKQ